MRSRVIQIHEKPLTICSLQVNKNQEWFLVNNKYALSSLNAVPIDPVCGIEMDEELAISHEHKGNTYYFCCEGCKRIFKKKPGKYSK